MKIRSIKVKKIAEQIRSNIKNRTEIWKIKRKIKQAAKKVKVKFKQKNIRSKMRKEKHLSNKKN